jgi:large subunit ribosomal protein L10
MEVAMPREEKVAQVAELEKMLRECSVGILTDYRGITAAESTQLRRKLGKQKLEFRVVKNTLARFAARNAGMPDLADELVGPLALVLGYEDEAVAAQAIDEYIRSSKSIMTIKGGFIADRLLTAEEVTALSKLPSREVLLAMVLGAMQAPITGLVNTLAAPMRGLVTVLAARKEQMEAN